MDFHANLLAHLNALTENLDDGTDLGAIVSVLVDDLTAAVPSLLGLDITIVIGTTPVTVSTMAPPASAEVLASLQLPLATMVGAAPGSVVTYYAAVPGAFTKLAAQTREVFDLDGDVKVDQHLFPRSQGAVTGLGELNLVNQAIGILMGRDGHGPKEATNELRRRADAMQETLKAAAQRLVDDPIDGL